MTEPVFTIFSLYKIVHAYVRTYVYVRGRLGLMFSASFSCPLEQLQKTRLQGFEHVLLQPCGHGEPVRKKAIYKF